MEHLRTKVTEFSDICDEFWDHILSKERMTLPDFGQKNKEKFPKKICISPFYLNYSVSSKKIAQ